MVLSCPYEPSIDALTTDCSSLYSFKLKPTEDLNLFLVNSYFGVEAKTVDPGALASLKEVLSIVSAAFLRLFYEI